MMVIAPPMPPTAMASPSGRPLATLSAVTSSAPSAVIWVLPSTTARVAPSTMPVETSAEIASPTGDTATPMISARAQSMLSASTSTVDPTPCAVSCDPRTRAVTSVSSCETASPPAPAPPSTPLTLTMLTSVTISPSSWVASASTRMLPASAVTVLSSIAASTCVAIRFLPMATLIAKPTRPRLTAAEPTWALASSTSCASTVTAPLAVTLDAASMVEDTSRVTVLMPDAPAPAAASEAKATDAEKAKAMGWVSSWLDVCAVTVTGPPFASTREF